MVTVSAKYGSRRCADPNYLGRRTIPTKRTDIDGTRASIDSARSSTRAMNSRTAAEAGISPRPAPDVGASAGGDFLAGGGESGARMRAVDWSHTALGEPGQWPRSLKTIVRMMLDSRYAMWMLWGPELTFFCNDAYRPTFGIRRDWVMGARSDKVWAEIWPDVWPRIDQVLTRGESTWDEALLLFLERSGFPEETYHTFSYSPVYDDAGKLGGMLCVVTEETQRVIA